MEHVQCGCAKPHSVMQAGDIKVNSVTTRRAKSFPRIHLSVAVSSQKFHHYFHWRPTMDPTLIYAHYIKNDCQWGNFHETQACSTTFCKQLVYRIPWKSVRWFSRVFSIPPRCKWDSLLTLTWHCRDRVSSCNIYAVQQDTQCGLNE